MYNLFSWFWFSEEAPYVIQTGFKHMNLILQSFKYWNKGVHPAFIF